MGATQLISQAVPAAAPRVDLMVIVTDKAIATKEIGSWKSAKNLAQHAVNQINYTILANSKMHCSFRLVEVGRTNYPENQDFATMLAELAAHKVLVTDSRRGGKYPVLASDLRDRVGADVVSMFVATDIESGVSYGMTKQHPSFESSAFSVVWHLAAMGRLSLAHELGHNFGCSHDRNNHQGAALTNYAFGHSFDIGNKRRGTIMCAGTNRLAVFSNPNVMMGGVPAGVPLGQPNSAFNAKVMDDSAPLVADFRKQAVP